MIYLDHHAASPMDEAVLGAIDDARGRAWANPSSAHAAGRAARSVLEAARDEIARAISAAPADVVLTGGGTEACNLGVLGLHRGGTIVTTSIEHPAVAEPLRALEARGANVIRVLTLEAFDQAIRGASLAAIQWVNHETGSIFPIEAMAERCRAAGVPLFVDATQALGKVPVDVAIRATAIALASSKIGGPPAAGALWIARDAPLTAQLLGGAQERGRRAGTPDPALHAGFGAACRSVAARLAAMPEVAARRDRIERALCELGAAINGVGPRVATALNVSVPRWRGTSLVAALDLEGVCASSGAACSSGVDEPSPVVRALHPEPWRAEAALRVTLAPSTTDAEIDDAIDAIRRVVGRKLSRRA